MKRWWAAPLLAVALLAGGCATVAPTGDPAPQAVAANPADPWENFNRRMFAFNETVDAAVMEPVARAYRSVVPQLVRTGISNVLGNLYDVWSMVNHLLQGKVHHGLDMGMRVLSNTFFGLGGLLDPATEMGLVRRSEDFGQTLGRWGMPPGPYLVLPLLGPSTLRDTGGLLVDRQASPSTLPDERAARYGTTVLEAVNLRAELLGTTSLLGQAALDKYSFMRDGFLARRLDQVYDGAAPASDADLYEDFGDDEPAPATPAAPSAPASAAQPAGAASQPAGAASQPAGTARRPATPTPAQRP